MLESSFFHRVNDIMAQKRTCVRLERAEIVFPPPQRGECHLRKIWPRAAIWKTLLSCMAQPHVCYPSVHTRVVCLRQEPLGCSLALKTGSKGVGLNRSSVLPCATQHLSTVLLTGDVTNYSLKACCIVPSKARGSPSCSGKWLFPPGLQLPPAWQPAYNR